MQQFKLLASSVKVTSRRFGFNCQSRSLFSRHLFFMEAEGLMLHRFF